MNVVITLPSQLIEAIKSGKKSYEMRKSWPRLLDTSQDGFFVVEKGTKNVVLWCRCDFIREEDSIDNVCITYRNRLGVSKDYIVNYMGNKKVYLWHIFDVVIFEKPLSLNEDLFVERAPQQFAYCSLSHGKSY